MNVSAARTWKLAALLLMLAATIPQGFSADTPSQWASSPLESVIRAARSGDPSAQVYIGRCCLDGVTFSIDPNTAAAWFRKAADRGNKDGQYALGNCYCNGLGVEPNVAEAQKLYALAANNGHPDAAFALATLAEKREDVELAKKWYDKAATNGHPTAAAKLQSLQGQPVVVSLTGVPRTIAAGEKLNESHERKQNTLVVAQTGTTTPENAFRPNTRIDDSRSTLQSIPVYICQASEPVGSLKSHRRIWESYQAYVSSRQTYDTRKNEIETALNGKEKSYSDELKDVDSSIRSKNDLLGVKRKLEKSEFETSEEFARRQEEEPQRRDAQLKDEINKLTQHRRAILARLKQECELNGLHEPVPPRFAPDQQFVVSVRMEEGAFDADSGRINKFDSIVTKFIDEDSGVIVRTFTWSQSINGIAVNIPLAKRLRTVSDNSRLFALVVADAGDVTVQQSTTDVKKSDDELRREQEDYRAQMRERIRRATEDANKLEKAKPYITALAVIASMMGYTQTSPSETYILADGALGNTGNIYGPPAPPEPSRQKKVPMREIIIAWRDVRIVELYTCDDSSDNTREKLWPQALHGDLPTSAAVKEGVR